MSALPAFTPRRLREAAIGSLRHLEVVSTRAQRRARPKLVYAVITVGGIGAILLAQLMLSIVVADGAYQISDLQVRQRDADRQQRDLDEQLELLGSTQNLTANAEALGMVASGNPVFLDLATGAVSGSPSAAGGSIMGGTNMIGNSLLDGTTVIDPAALEAARQAADAAAAAGTGTDGGSALGEVPAVFGAPAEGSSTGAVPSKPGALPSPLAR